MKLRKALHLKVKIGKKASGRNREKKYSTLQFGDIVFYRQLLNIGLTPRKSLTLNEIKVPKEYFKDFLRGVIDGDGSINKWTHRTNRKEQWCLRVASGAPIFANWLCNEIIEQFKVTGKIYHYQNVGKNNPLYTLKFGKVATKIILQNIYYQGCLALQRKYEIAIECLKSEEGWHRYGKMVL